MHAYLEDNLQSPEPAAGSGVGDTGEGDWRTTCRRCGRRIWRQDGCTACEPTARKSTEVRDTSENPSLLSPVALNARGRSSGTRNNPEAAGASSDLICGLPRAVAEYTLERCFKAFGGLAGLNVRLDAWDAPKPAGPLHDRAVHEFRDEYHRIYRGGDEEQHDEAIDSAVAAVLALAESERAHG